MFSKLSLIAIALTACIVLSACSEEPRRLRIVTDRADLIYLAQSFITANPGVVIDIRYNESVSSAFRKKQLDSDIVIGQGLFSPPVYERAFPLDEFQNYLGENSNKYLDITFSAGTFEQSPRVVLLAFNLPAFISKKNVDSQRMEFWDRNTIELAMVRDIALNSVNSSSKVLLGLSLSSNPLLLEVISRNFGAAFESDANGLPIWNTEALRQSLLFTRDWLIKSALTLEKEQNFAQKYGAWPYWNLLDQNICQISYSSIAGLLESDPSRSQNYTLQWLSRDRSIEILPDAIGALISETCQNRKLAMQFLAYIMSEPVQNNHIKIISRNNYGSFGFLGGFSTQREVYSKVFPTIYPILALTLPPEEGLKFPRALPLEYNEWSAKVLRSFLSESLEGTLDISILEARTRQWLLQKGLEP